MQENSDEFISGKILKIADVPINDKHTELTTDWSDIDGVGTISSTTTSTSSVGHKLQKDGLEYLNRLDCQKIFKTIPLTQPVFLYASSRCGT